MMGVPRTYLFRLHAAVKPASSVRGGAGEGFRHLPGNAALVDGDLGPELLKELLELRLHPSTGSARGAWFDRASTHL